MDPACCAQANRAISHVIVSNGGWEQSCFIPFSRAPYDRHNLICKGHNIWLIWGYGRWAVMNLALEYIYMNFIRLSIFLTVWDVKWKFHVERRPLNEITKFVFWKERISREFALCPLYREKSMIALPTNVEAQEASDREQRRRDEHSRLNFLSPSTKIISAAYGRQQNVPPGQIRDPPNRRSSTAGPS